jgi:hypothetical protein
MSMKAEELDSVVRNGTYPDGLTHVLVRAKKTHGDGYKWTSGRPTGNTGQYDEHFEVLTDSPLVEADKQMYHKEDIKNPSNTPSLEEMNGE